MNWASHLLSPPSPAIGFKKLSKKSVRAETFLAEHADLRVTAAALKLGTPGQYVPAFADVGAKSTTASFFLLDELLSQAQATTEVAVLEPGTAEVPGTDLAIVEEPAGQGDLEIVESGQAFGSKLENKIAVALREFALEKQLDVQVASKGSHDAGRISFQLTDYWPFRPPPTALEDRDLARVYEQLGRGHLIQPDVLVWRNVERSFARVTNRDVEISGYNTPQLVACISGKATIRSDRSQSSRYEGSTISRWRRARPPHFAVVTAEPTPNRLGSLAWGLGEIDCVYHIGLAALFRAIVRMEDELGGADDSQELQSLIEHSRLRDVSQLPDDVFSEML